MVPYVNSVTIPGNMEGATYTLTYVAGTQMKSASSSATVMEVAEVKGSTLSDTTEAASTNITSAASLARLKEVLPTPSGTSTHIGPEPGPTTVEGAPSDRSTKIITVASPEMYGVGVDMTRSPKNVGPTGPTTDDGAI
jgi:hypothetical protein